MSRVLTTPAGRRAKWLVLGVWLLLLVALGPLAGKFEDAQSNETSSFLPGSAESVKALDQVKQFPGGELAPAILVYHRAGGLTGADRARIGADRARIEQAEIQGVRAVTRPIVSRDRTTSLVTVPIAASGDTDTLIDATKDVRRLQASGHGLQTAVTGPAGFSTDAVDVFAKINGTLLLATGLLVFVLLILIYRSPIFWFIPLFSVLAAEALSRSFGYLLAEAGVTINGQSAGILGVLVFGVGTDYALLVVSRYREELRRHEDKHEAMQLALGRTGPTVVASALTVVASLLCLLIAEVTGTAGLGPIGALGVLLAATSMLTLLPALLTICGRRAFWPFIPRYGGTETDSAHGPWRRIGQRIAKHPRRVWIGTAAGLVVLCFGLAFYDTGLTQPDQFRNDVEAVQGQKLIAAAFPSGTNAPTDVVVPKPATAPAVLRSLRTSGDVVSARLANKGRPGVLLSATLEADPYGQAGFDAIPRLRARVKAAGGADVLVGGPTAEERDLRASSSRDSTVIPPVVILVVLVILSILLRAIAAAAVLVATVVLSYGAALGVAYFAYDKIFGFAGSDPSLPLFAFIFLVGLGVDYIIFLMTRVREEAAQHGTKEGTVRALAVTGGVITSAGIVLAGTFSTLAVLPLVPLTEIGFSIAFGVLLDAFVVRSVLVPAVTMDLGDRIWWPSRPPGSSDR